MNTSQLTPLAWQREAERQRGMAQRAANRGEWDWHKRHDWLAGQYAAKAREGMQ